MKTKLFIAMAIVAILGITFAVTACKNDEEPPPNDDAVVKERSTTITPVEGLELTVTGEFDKAGLTSAAGKIEAAIRGYFETLPDPVKVSSKAKYAKCEAIIVEKTTEYTQWKTNGDGKTIYINFDLLNSGELAAKIRLAIESMDASKAQTGDPCACPNETVHSEGETCCNSAIAMTVNVCISKTHFMAFKS